MLDHRQAVAGSGLGHSNPACRVSSNHGSAGDSEFDFWGGRSLNHDQFRDELQRKPDSEGFEWKSRNSIEYEFSPLLPNNYQHSNLSPRKRSEAIAQGRRELMEMIRDMPECSYELSLKDIVDEEKNLQGMKEEMVIDVTSTEDQVHGQKKKKVESGLKKKSTSRNRSKVSPRTSFERSENHHDKVRRMKMISEVAEIETRGKKSSKNNTSRKVEVSAPTGCWPFFHTKKNRSRGHRGCIF